ncbi:glycosyltransferase family 4 protein [Argonema galeatum]|uniref:glycosyltransferase family 4 protein n=1 Tax=Argonema galeatum TaxID=2942762 RepID=UPI0020111C68|nr:glycosyltransferase family 4 protein [Argonema galeatum]MCL1467421.1 glycosyltransferase family 4 protein [Argonema galeatum A003/A1]
MINKSEPKKMQITLVTPSLSCGGAERAAVLVAEGLMAKGHQVSIITIAGIERDFYQLSKGVHRLALSIAANSPTPIHALWNNLYRLWVLRKTIKSLQPKVVISFLDSTNILTLLALINTNYPIFVSEQNNPITETTNLWSKLRRLTYPMAAKVVSVSEGVDSYFDWLPQKKRAVIYNPVQPIKDEPINIDLPPGADPEKKWAIAMGRLTYQKGFDLLLPAFHKIADKYPDWQLLIFGEGELRRELEELREKLGLTRQVLFPGLTTNPIAMLKSAKLFVLSSRWEGLPAVLFEALSCGLPVVSMNCPSGPQEIIRDGIDGILVPNGDVSAFTLAMDSLMSDAEKRGRLAARASEAVDRFSLDKVVKKWELLIDEVLEEKVK